MSYSPCSIAFTQPLPDSLKLHKPADRPISLTFDQARRVIKAEIEVRNLRYQVNQLDSASSVKDSTIAVLQGRLGSADALVISQARTIRRQRGELWGHRGGLLALLIKAFIPK